ncbi:hypothetical protein [Microbulbifer sp. VAAF005]|uniref:hypothetical protein n=1 Tax=Microbulbifer sp. VAAF005 TaxID=3034230 RepID=UPI0024AD60DF|nr:hypothetical protein [Microbulbifer sp. VAAF005]WHI45015.1 hypothetical protein P0078_14880 [Microbulbifer sp. VAAF005]
MEHFWNIDGTTRNMALVTSYQSAANIGNSPKARKPSNGGASSKSGGGVFHLVPKKMEQGSSSTGRIKPSFKGEIGAMFHCSGFFYPLRAFFSKGGA